MRKRYEFRAPRWGLSLLAGSLLLSACGDSTTEPEPPEYHADDVEGVQLVLSARTIATYDGPAGTWSDSFEIDAGELSGHIDVRFVDANGNAVQLGDDFYLEVESEDPSIASFIQDDPGGFAIHIQGVADGETGLVFRLMHGAIGSGHADFITAPFDVHVHGHATASDVEGVQLVSGGETIAAFDHDTETWSASFEIDEGETSGHIDVHFVDHDGDALEFGDDYYLEVESEDPAIASFIQDNPGGFAIHIQGVADGETGLVFRLMHGAIGSGHADFETEPFEVHVHGHATASAVEGVQLVLGDETIATFDHDTEMWSDDFEIDEGETSGHIDVHFVDHDGDVLEFGDDYYLEVESEDPAIASYIQDDPGGFAIHIRGVEAGETGLVFRLMHGAVGSGHADFETEPLEVHVHAHATASAVEGVQLVLGDETIATFDHDTEMWSDDFEIDEGETSGHIDVHFVDHDGDVLEFGDDYYLEVESEDSAIASYIQDDPGGFAIHIRGVEAGETGLVFRLMHGAVGSGHADFETEPLEVHVHAHATASAVEGVQLVLGEETIATFDHDTEMWSDDFEIDEGETSGHIDVHFVDHDGDALEFGDDYYLEVESEDPAIASYIQDDPGGFAIHIRGVEAGETGLVFRLMHGAVGSGHADFETEPLEVHVHAHATAGAVEGVQLVLGEETIATFDHDTETWSAHFDVKVGETSGHIDVHFVDHDGDALEFGDDYYLEVESEDPAIASYIQDDPGGFAIHIRGVAAGETGLVFRLMHGAVGSGHADFETEALEVHVVPAS